MALAYFALGDDATDAASGHLRDYYGFAPPYAEMVLNNAAVGVAGVTGTVEAFRAAGCDELILVPCTADLDQVKLLSTVLTEHGHLGQCLGRQDTWPTTVRRPGV